MEQVGRKPNDGIQPVQCVDQVLADVLLSISTEQHTVRQQHGHTAILFVHVMHHVLQESKVGMTLRGQLARTGIAGIVQHGGGRIPLQGIRGIADLNGHRNNLAAPGFLVLFVILVLQQGIGFVDVEILPVDAVHDHVHASQVVRGSVLLLPVVMADLPSGKMLLDFQQHGRRSTCTVADRLRRFKTLRGEHGAQLGWTGGREELSTLLTSLRLEQADQDHVGRAQHVKLSIFKVEVDVGDLGHHLSDQLGTRGNRVAKLRVIQAHIGEQAVESLAGTVPSAR